MSKIAFLYPGQGAQVAGMGKDFYEKSPLAKEVFDKSCEILGQDMKHICFEENELLDRTDYTQAALVTTCMAMTKEIMARGLTPDMTAGLSLGEYCAITTAGGMELEDAIKMVWLRGNLMHNAVPEGKGGMAAVLGLSGEAVNEAIAYMEGVYVANYNCPGQIVITGDKEAVENAAPALKEAGAIALSDDGRPVINTEFMAEAMQAAPKLGMTVVSHCEDLYLAKGGIIHGGKVAEKLGVKGIPAAAEDCGTAREIALAAAYNVPIHICHVSTATSIALIRDAKARGVAVTAETAPHYFTLTEEELLKRDADYRMNPPLRTEADRLAVIEALKDGTLDAIATDHAPHTPEEKADFEKAPNGAIGMETSLSAGITTLVKQGHCTMLQLIEKMSTKPAQLLGIPAGTLKKGSPADVILIDKDEEWPFDADKLHGKSKNCVFKNRKLTGKVKFTVCGGKIVFNELD